MKNQLKFRKEREKLELASQFLCCKRAMKWKFITFIMIYDTLCHFKLVFSSNVFAARRDWDFYFTLMTNKHWTRDKRLSERAMWQLTNRNYHQQFTRTSMTTIFCFACRPTLSNVLHRIPTSETIHQVVTTVQWSLKLRQPESQKRRRRRRKRTQMNRKSKTYFHSD